MTDWMQRAFPTLSPTEAEAMAESLGDVDRHKLRELMATPDPGGLSDGLALLYSRVISTLMAEKSRKTDAHRRRWLVWRLSGGNLERNDVGKTVTSFLAENEAIAADLGFEKRRRAAIVKDLLKEMRAAVRDGARPYTLSAHEEERLATWLAFDKM